MNENTEHLYPITLYPIRCSANRLHYTPFAALQTTFAPQPRSMPARHDPNGDDILHTIELKF